MASNVLVSRQVKTSRVVQFMIATRYRKSLLMGMSLHPPPGSTCLHVREENLIVSRDCELPQQVWINVMLWVLFARLMVCKQIIAGQRVFWPYK